MQPMVFPGFYSLEGKKRKQNSKDKKKLVSQ